MQDARGQHTVNLCFWDRVFHLSYSLPQYWLDSKPALQHWDYRHSQLLLHECYLSKLWSHFILWVTFPDLTKSFSYYKKIFYWCLLIVHNTGYTGIFICKYGHYHPHILSSYFSPLPSPIRPLLPLDTFTFLFMSYIFIHSFIYQYEI